MRTLSPPMVRTELALMLVGLSLLAPRLATIGSGALRALPEESVQATVGYAKHRLWSDFLSDRERLLPGQTLPSPTLSEYRNFLSGLGLKRRGDMTSLLVLPPDPALAISDEIDVELAQVQSPIVLKLYVNDAKGSPQAAGALQILADDQSVITCQAQAVGERKFLSYWPVRPGCVLP